MTSCTRTLLAVLALFALALPASAAAKSKPKPIYYVSLGDSWSEGVQPLGRDQADIPTKKGYERTVLKLLRKKHKNLKLVELGCGGATTQSMIDGSKPCTIEKRPYKSKSKATSQLTYAKKWLKKHRKRVRYVSVIIGGNDVAPCAAEDSDAAIAACVSKGLDQIKKNLKVIAKGVRSSAGKKAHIVGSTYADVVLGQWVKSEHGKDIAKLSISIFKDQINPTLKSAYEGQKIKFVDATAKFGAYIPLDQTTTMAPYGEIPIAVANICKYGWYCNDRATPDIHLKASGYAKLGKLVYAKIK